VKTQKTQKSNFPTQSR